MKDNLKTVFFELLRIGLWGKGTCSIVEPLSDKDWSIIYQCAINHTVEGIIFDSFLFLAEEQLPPRALRMKWAVRIDQIERYNIQMEQVTAEQFTNFVQQGLKPILLKGQGVANCYLNPSHRISGDIDWYFEENGYDQAFKLLQDKGVVGNSHLNFCLDYQWQGISIEHHRRLFDIRSLFKISYLNKLEKAYQIKQQSILIDGISVTLLAPELQILQVNTHILKHLLGFGVGMRQICDSAMLYHTYHNKIDVRQLYIIYKKAGILKWIHLLHGILVKYIGLPNEEIPFPFPNNLKVDWMMEEIWQSGNFGYHDDRYATKKKTFISAYPGGAQRLLRSIYLYFRYAPQETIFFPLRRTTARLTSIFSLRK